MQVAIIKNMVGMKKRERRGLSMIHLIAFAQVGKEKIAYHFSSKDQDKILDKQDVITNSPLFPKYSSAFSLHVLKTESESFESVGDMDPYFKDVTVKDDFSEFIKLIDDDKADAVEVAAYLKRKFRLQSFALEKVLYYIYADFLEKGNKLFTANFVAFGAGPVDRDVYRHNKYVRDFEEDRAFNRFLMKRSDSLEIIKKIDSIANKYGDYYDRVWDLNKQDNSDYNLTHKDDTPWYIAKKNRGRNGTILDSDIIKYHYKELLNK